MSWTLGQVKARVRNLVDDPNVTWTKDDFIVPLINEIYDDYNSKLASTGDSWDIGVVEVPGIQPGTPNMAPFQIGTGPLATLTDQPERIDWKVAGNDPSYYQLVPNYQMIPDVQPLQFMAGWEWRSNVIWLTPSSIAVDLRVRGEFAPSVLANDDDVLTSAPRMGYAVAYGTAEICATVRGNAAWEKTYGLKAMEGMDEIMSQLTKDSQGQVRRLGRQTMRGARRGYR
jgi:hypothetical protein